MSDTEKIVLMKCAKCGYEEEVPEWVLQELNEFDNDEEYQMICPECEAVMYEKSKKKKHN